MEMMDGLHRRPARCVSLLAALLLAVIPLSADELVMKDGSRLLGKVGKQENGTLEFETTYAGTIKVKWDQVRELHADEPVQITLKNEQLQEATTITKTDDATVVAALTEGAAESLAPDAIIFINPEPWRYGEGYKSSGLFNIALKSERGNTKGDEIELDAELGWRWKDDRVSIYGQLEKETSFGKTTSQNWLSRGKYDHFHTEEFYYGANLGFEHDEFADLELRTKIGPHLGHQFFGRKSLHLSTDLGLMYVDENFISARDDHYVALSWLVNYDWFVIPDQLQFYHRHDGLLSLASMGDLVINSSTGFRFPLVFGAVASVEAEIKYDGGAPADIDKMDTTYRAKMGYQW